MIKYLIYLCIFFFLILLLPQKAFANDIIFSDNFDDDDISDWTVARNMQWDDPSFPCLNNNLPTSWIAQNGKVGIKISGPGCVTELVPTNFVLPQSINYAYNFDMEFTNTTAADRNVIFRYGNPNDWYDFKFYGGTIWFQKLIGSYYRLETNAYNFQPNQTYHFRIEVDSTHIRLFINKILVWDIVETSPYIPSATIGLQASVGANPNSEVWFDNISVEKLLTNSLLQVPYYSQNDPQWGPSEYDHASSVSVLPPTMDRWGCAVTSAAMVLNYHGMTEFTNNTKLDPGTLNNWLKTNNGYLTGTSSNGGYAYLSWPAISKLTQDLYSAGKAPIKLMHQRHYPSATTTAQLKDDLTVQNIPNIFQVQNASTSGHFVVATGLTNTGYTLNDPEWNVPDTSSFGDSFMQVDRFVPSQTNLSYIVIVSNPNVNFVVTDSNGNKTGKEVINGQIQTFNDISQATYALENPISNPSANNVKEQLGSSMNVFLLPVPSDGTYTINVTNQTNNDYYMNIQTFDLTGNSQLNKINGIVGGNRKDVITLTYSQTQPSSIVISRPFTIDDLINDVKQAKVNEYIRDNSMYKQLLQVLNQITKEDIKFNRRDYIDKNLNKFLEKLAVMKKAKQITEKGYQLLLADLQSFRNSLVNGGGGGTETPALGDGRLSDARR